MAVARNFPCVHFFHFTEKISRFRNFHNSDGISSANFSNFIHSLFFQHVCSMNSSFIMFHTLKSSVRIVDKAPILIITNVQKIEVKTILVRNVAKFLRRKIVWEFISKGIIQLPKKHICARHVKNVLEITNFWKTIFSNHITSRIAHSAKRLCLTKWN